MIGDGGGGGAIKVSWSWRKTEFKYIVFMVWNSKEKHILINQKKLRLMTGCSKCSVLIDILVIIYVL